MRRLALPVLACLFFAGCQCFSVNELVYDGIDAINDCPPTFDECYHARWDLTRIGRRDWCASRLNRLWCGDSCNRCRPYLPPYLSYEAWLALRPETRNDSPVSDGSEAEPMPYLDPPSPVP